MPPDPGVTHCSLTVPAPRHTGERRPVYGMPRYLAGAAASVLVAVRPAYASPVAKIVYRTATALTGYIADEHQSLDWLFAVEGGEAPPFAEFLATVGVLVQGSTTYEWVLRQEDLLEQPDKWQVFYGGRPTYVFTSRELPVPAGADVRFVRGPVAAVLPGMRAAAGERDLWVVGGGDLAGQFADVDALDEVVLTVAPVALPKGAPVLPRRLDASRLHLDEVKRQGQFVELTYQLRRPATQGQA